MWYMCCFYPLGILTHQAQGDIVTHYQAVPISDLGLVWKAVRESFLRSNK